MHVQIASWVCEYGHPDLLRPLVGDYVSREEDVAALLGDVLLRDRHNVFNLSNCEGDECGEVHFPAAAMMNHSCVPNVEARAERGTLVVRTLHRVAAGEELNHVYVPLTAHDEERRTMLRNTWGFVCQCAR